VARVPVLALGLAALGLAACGGSGTSTTQAPARTATPAAPKPAPAKPARRRSPDWSTFGAGAQRAYTGLTAASVRRLHPRTIRLDGTVDSSPVLVHGIGGRDLLIVTTTYGKTIALNARTGGRVWEFTPRGIGGWAGSYRITTATPAIDRALGEVYASSPDGRVHALRLSSGREAASWSVTKDATHEKIASPLKLDGHTLLVSTGGYLGDAPPYQGHVVAIDVKTRRILNVWNSLCSDRRAIIVPSTCSASDSAFWSRAGAVVEPGSHRILLATGNGPFDGHTNWGDSVLELEPAAAGLRQSWTPRNEAQLSASDTDLGSTAPALLPPHYAIQGGKDGVVRLLDVRHLGGVGGELQSFSGARGGYAFTAPAVGSVGGAPYAFTADTSTVAYRLSGSPLRLHPAWSNATPGTSPVLAGGLLYVYDEQGGALNVYRPGSGTRVASLPAAPGHWNSPIVYDGRVALPVGNANDRSQSGTLLLYR
jgi:hypothetical protein